MTLRHNAPLRDADPAIANLVNRELLRQRHGLELIASENFASRAVIDAIGTPLTNKYAEGYPGKRYYGGCEVVDEVERLAIARALQLFGADHANVQPHAGAQANFAAFMAVLPPGGLLLGMSLPHGGHLSHGHSVNHSGTIWRATHYGVNPATGRIDYDQVREQARAERPGLIICGGSAYARIIDFPAFREHRRRGRRHVAGGHVPLCRAGGRWGAPLPGAARADCHHHDPQDPPRPPRRPDPLRRRSGQGDRSIGLSRHPGWTA